MVHTLWMPWARPALCTYCRQTLQSSIQIIYSTFFVHLKCVIGFFSRLFCIDHDPVSECLLLLLLLLLRTFFFFCSFLSFSFFMDANQWLLDASTFAHTQTHTHTYAARIQSESLVESSLTGIWKYTSRTSRCVYANGRGWLASNRTDINWIEQHPRVSARARTSVAIHRWIGWSLVMVMVLLPRPLSVAVVDDDDDDADGSCGTYNYIAVHTARSRYIYSHSYNLRRDTQHTLRERRDRDTI